MCLFCWNSKVKTYEWSLMGNDPFLVPKCCWTQEHEFSKSWYLTLAGLALRWRYLYDDSGFNIIDLNYDLILSFWWLSKHVLCTSYVFPKVLISIIPFQITNPLIHQLNVVNTASYSGSGMHMFIQLIKPKVVHWVEEKSKICTIQRKRNPEFM